MAPFPKGAGAFREVLAEFGLEVATGGTMAMAPAPRCSESFPGPASRPNVDDKLPHHSTGLLDLFERPLELNVSKIWIRLVVSNGELGPCLPAYLLRVHTSFPNHSTSKGSIHTDLGSG